MKFCTLLAAVPLFLFFSTEAGAQQTAEHRIPFIEAEIFSIDRSHSNLGFTVGFMGFTEVKGTFDDFSATILYNEEEMSKTAIILRIDVSSIDTGSDFRDRDLLGKSFFDAENHPEIIFKSKRITGEPGGEYLVTGDLTMKGVTREISIPVQHVLKRTEDPVWGNIRMGFSGQATVNRLDYEITGGSGIRSQSISEEVQIDFMLLGRIFNLERIAWRSNEKPSIGEEMEKVLGEKGFDAALAFYKEAKTKNPNGYNFAARELNLLAGRLKQSGAIEGALKISDLYLAAYPESASAHAQRGELLAIRGDREGAAQHFERALELAPGDDLIKMVLNRLNENNLNK